MTGCTTHQSIFEQWDSLEQDHAEYLTHIEIAWSNKSDIYEVFRLMAGSETTYVHPDFDIRLWDAHAPSVTIRTCTPEDIPQVYAAARCIIGCDCHAASPAPPQSHPRLLHTHLICHQWFHLSFRLLPTRLFVRMTSMLNRN